MADESDSVTAPGADDERASGSRRSQRRRRGKNTKGRPFWQEVPILIVIAAVIAALVVNFIGRPYVIPSESMEPTLHGCTGCTGDRIYVEKLSYDFGDPKPGDVVVFVGPSDSWNKTYHSNRSSNVVVRGVQNFFSFFGLVPPDENDLVKRVIAVGGQTVQCCDVQGRVMVDGKPLDEPYARYIAPYVPGVAFSNFNPLGREFGPVKVPEGNLWVMGDNRNRSADSRAHMDDRYQGTVPVSDVRGKAVFKIWPPNRIGPVRAQNPQ
ncbi:signal peptidase I [Nocardia terpenica]|uniref:Signal peptidase I n=1 Tax=Nocardia terpenica TaxID=455432 RepID=A0A164NQT2_9NOCA|nr:signal peptidase I [Nocardia terpenica]KZM74621.1 signal peptidase I [Nocardia terpenica]NQE93789.1 signal peptidase I [Nocardia terpenica]